MSRILKYFFFHKLNLCHTPPLVCIGNSLHTGAEVLFCGIPAEFLKLSKW